VIEIAVSDLFDREAMTRHFRKLAIYLGANDIRSSLKNDTSWFEQADEEASSKAVSNCG
jgi:hypothetical protein